MAIIINMQHTFVPLSFNTLFFKVAGVWSPPLAFFMLSIKKKELGYMVLYVSGIFGGMSSV